MDVSVQCPMTSQVCDHVMRLCHETQGGWPVRVTTAQASREEIFVTPSGDVTQDAGPSDHSWWVTPCHTHYSYTGFVLESVMLMLLGSGVMYGECDGPEPRVRSSSDIWSQVKMFTESRANAHLLHYSSHYQAGLSKVCPVRAMTTFYNNNNIPTDPHIACNNTPSQRGPHIYITESVWAIVGRAVLSIKL